MCLCVGALGVVGSVAACGPAKPAETPVHEDESPPAASTSGTASVDTPVAPPPPVAQPAPPPPSSGVPYDKESVEIGLKRAARQVKANCGAATDEEGKASGPWGKTTVTVKIGHNGHSQGVTIGAPYDGKPVGKCVAQAFSGGDATVDWPVEIVQPGAH